ncbi:OmpA family protein [Flavobacterium sp. HSC-61S13]|uniref:OmpA family protein n=1 Tax=Flavobacterium sp. HSC-61S13 TaxID=2910963 RepID=UPI0020A03356|nr:OmpA family protein [Flavobacterium sp. HSC-61S13]MCP1996141.1 outer membrane protein OmpA-like peptidoglycan-associated protein [Flavobacterium sp. HSC-61S13]
MKTTYLLFILCLVFFACNSNKKESEAALTDSVAVHPSTQAEITEVSSPVANDMVLDWSDIPALEDIGNFPFIKAPKGLAIEKEENGLTQVFEYEQMVNYFGEGQYYPSEGKLGMLFFEFNSGPYNNRYFDKNIYTYLDEIGAKKLFAGEIVRNDLTKERLKDNQYDGKYRFSSISDSYPFSVYAFKNKGKKYLVTVQSNTSLGTIYIMELKDFVPTIEKYTAEHMQAEIDKTGKAVLQINFDTNKATLKQDGREVADQIIQLLKADGTLKLSIEGHTDNTGDPQKNIQLSKERAQAVLSYLVEHGITSSRLKSNGFGATKALFSNDTEEHKAQNRRVELVKIN